MTNSFTAGISLNYIRVSDNPIHGNYSSRFNALEMTGNIDELVSRKIPESVVSLHLTDCLPPSLTHSIAEQPVKIINQFIDELNRIIDKAQGLPPASLSMDFALEQSMESLLTHRQQVALLKQIMPIFFRYNLKLCLPIRIPFINPELASYHLSVLTEVMSPLLCMEVNIHPHEIGKKFDPSILLKWLEYDIEKIRFIYELDLGNSLTPVLIKRWWHYLKYQNFSGSVLFAPSISSDDLFLREMDFLKEFISKIDIGENNDISNSD